MSRANLARQLPEVGVEALGLLDPARGSLEVPVRSEIFGALRFAQHGKSLGEAHHVRAGRRRSPFFPRLGQNIAVLREAHAFLSLQVRTGHHVHSAGEWLLDNFYVILGQLKEIHDALPRRYFRDLPVLADAHLAGLPRVYGVAWAFVAHSDSAFDEGLLVQYLRAYQQAAELTLGELWALPTTLRVVLVENLRRLAERVATAKAARSSANLWSDRFLAAGRTEPMSIEPVLAEMQARGVLESFALQVLVRLDDDALMKEGSADLVAPVRAAITRLLPDPVQAQVQLHAAQAADDLSVRNAITALRTLGDADWRGIVGETSLLLQTLAESALFHRERADTQDQTLHAIERLARRARTSELHVARVLLQHTESRVGDVNCAASAPDCTAAPLWWLQGPGLPTLRQALGIDQRVTQSWRSRLRRGATPLYLGSIIGGTLALAWLFAAHQQAAGVRGAALAVMALLALWPASEAVVALLHRLISESLPPDRLPRLALAEGFSPAERVLVVIPALLTGTASVRALVHQLELHYLANAERHTQFALLTDFTDADAQSMPGDVALLAEATDALDTLERRYGSPKPGARERRFLLLHRERSWSNSERCWMGRERKRGKLEVLLTLLAEGGASPFIDLGACSQPAAQTVYVLTLDADTGLPLGTLRALVGVAAHPLNHPQIDPKSRRVHRGYGILQPRLLTPLPAARDATPFHWLFAGHCGIDPYSAASSEVYQDVFGEGTFSGKGLLHVQAVHAVLAGRLPSEQILSHDLLEGAIARCGGVSDVTLIEDAPLHADVAASRVHRWTRGDWQLLPVLARPWRYGLPTIQRWKMLDNLRRSMVAPVALVLLVLMLATDAGAPWSALVLVAAGYLVGPLLGAIAGLAPARDDIALAHFYREALADLLRAIAVTLWDLAMLLGHAVRQTHAIALAVWRTLVSRRGLLRWTTAAAAQAGVQHRLPGLVKRHAVESAAAIALGAVLLTATPAPRLAAALACAVWACVPLWVWIVSRPWHVRAEQSLRKAERDYLAGVAQDTWQFFVRHVGPATHDLPPDNVQQVPSEMVAERTSPTNIGLYLLSVACAQRFGFVTTAELIDRCEHTLATLDQMERYRGHFLNWYDTRTLAPLLPRYVSTVDSGNLCGHLIALAGACEALVEEGGSTVAPLHAGPLRQLAARSRQLAGQAEFGFLFDKRRKLLHIGWRVAENEADANYYDLLASESRLASLWAIGKGDVPVAHWTALGRPFYAVGTTVGLRSWSGSMFEYLMPLLVMHEPDGSALERAVHAALCEQVSFGQAHGVPWGVSESAYAASDHTLAYQYAPQGVPRLALRRTPADELVVAPYATALAAQVDPAAAVANFQALEALGARGAEGFIEALDYTPDRQLDGSTFTRVQTHMAHHQGMTLVALANVLLAGAPRSWALRDARLEAVASLLQERVPREVSRLLEPEPLVLPTHSRDGGLAPLRAVVPADIAVQPTLLLSNGRYSVALRSNGAGWSQHAGVDVSRWRDDALRDDHGNFFFVRRTEGLAAGKPYSLSQRPAPDPAAEYRTVFHADHACLHAQWPDLSSVCTVWVSPEDDIELRRVELHHHGDEPLSIELLSVFEVALLAARADEAHPAFANLFVRAHWDAASRALYLARRPNVERQAPVHAVHFLAHADHPPVEVRAQADRTRWQGRHHGLGSPIAHFEPEDAHSGERITGLDPVAALSVTVMVPAHGRVSLTFATAAADSREALETLVDRYQQKGAIERSVIMSSTVASVRQRDIVLTPTDRAAVQNLASLLALLHARPAAGKADAGTIDRRALWRLGISGDRPILVVEVGTIDGLRLVQTLVQALRQWAWGNLACDLVVVNTEPWSYLMPLVQELRALRERHAAELALPDAARNCALYIVQKGDLGAGEEAALRWLARVRFVADGRPLAHHVGEWLLWHEAARQQRVDAPHVPTAAGAAASAPTVQNGTFEGDGSFSFEVGQGEATSRPWTQVLANAEFGGHVSEAGTGWTWAANSRLNQLTLWTNDAVEDGGGERFLLQNLDTGDTWALGAGPGAADVRYRARYDFGVATIAHQNGPLEVSAHWCTDPAAALKQVRIVLHNRGAAPLSLRVAGIFEWLMGSRRVDRQTVRTAAAPLLGAGAGAEVLFATQNDNQGGFGGGTAVVWLQDPQGHIRLVDWTCDRRELFDGAGRAVLPHRLGKRAGAGLDPCAALSTSFDLSAGGTAQCTFVIGWAPSLDAARTLAADAAATDPEAREDAARGQWRSLLGAVQVHTPDPLFDALANGWLCYQSLACRLWARAGFYQAGGAFGFRDQLQDVMALALLDPKLLRTQMLLAASRQFIEGDVQHWWHPPEGAGVRTRCSDDLLWLPLAAVRYVQLTGDAAVLAEPVPFLEGAPVPGDAQDSYYVPTISAQVATLYEHCARAIDRSLAVGPHGLPLMGSGDWNDGMNRIGDQGQGESVWLGWFLCHVVEGMVGLADAQGDAERAARWGSAAEGWGSALRGPAWDGAWFTRAFFDDGTPLGTHTAQECRIDLIAQAWSVLSGVATPEQQAGAMDSARRMLTDDAHCLTRLLDPPLVDMQPSAGYIQAYPPGVRENGGQYSHGVVWWLMAQAQMGDAAGAWRTFCGLSPAHRAADAEQAARYGLEPYVMAADIYTQPPWTGRGGWSWYTGSAAWMYRAAIETFLGLAVQGEAVRFDPCLPPDWPAATLVLRRGAAEHRFVLCSGPDVAQVTAARARGAQVLEAGEWLTLPVHAHPEGYLLVVAAVPEEAGPSD